MCTDDFSQVVEAAFASVLQSCFFGMVPPLQFAAGAYNASSSVQMHYRKPLEAAASQSSAMYAIDLRARQLLRKLCPSWALCTSL